MEGGENMANNNLHVVKTGNMWKVKRAQSERASRCFDTQKKAIEYAVPKAKKNHVEVVIHGKDGRIQKGYNYNKEETKSKRTKKSSK